MEETTSFEVEERAANPWLIAGGLLFVIAFVLGWRSVRSNKRDAIGSRTDGTSA